MYEIEIKNKLKEITGLESVKLSVSPPKVDADIATNAALTKGMDAVKIAAELKNLNCIEDVKISGPGFINIKITDVALFDEVKEIAQNPDEYGRWEKAEVKSEKLKVKSEESREQRAEDRGQRAVGSRQRAGVIFEMVSSNPTGPLHIGHGRGAAIGDTLARIFEWVGFKVFREYYVNDTGKQMNLLGESIDAVSRGKEIPEDGYRGSYIVELAQKLKGLSNARDYTVKASQYILEDHFNVLKKFGVEYDNVFYESKLIENKKVNEIISRLHASNLTYEKDGALWFKSTKYGDDTDRVLRKKDGDLTYFAYDCAYHSDKAERFPYLVNIWGADHHGYIPRMRSFWKAMGYENLHRLEIVLYQLVDLKRGNEKVSMSTRQGEFVTLEEVIDEVGRDASRFFLLSRSAGAPLEFDLKLAKEESKKNPVYYVQYSHARICSVFKKAGLDPLSLDYEKVYSLGSEERELIKVLAHFPYLLSKCIDLMAPHLLTEYLRDVATAFHKYYDTVRVLGSSCEKGRLVLLKAVKDIIKNGLSIVGVSAPESM